MSEHEEQNESPVSFQEGVRGIWRHARVYRGVLSFIAIFGLISAVANGVVPYVTGLFFDALIVLSRGETVHAAGLPYWMILLALWALTRVVADSVDWWTDRRRRWLNTHLHLDTQGASFIHLLQLPLSFHTDEHLQEIFARVNAASWRTSSIMETIIQVSPQLLSIIIGISFAVSINPTLAAILAFGVVAYAIVLIILLRGTAEIDIIAHHAWSESWDDASAAIAQALSVKQATAEQYEIARIRKSMMTDVPGLWYKNEITWSRINLWQRVIVFFTQFTVFVVSAYFVAAGIISVGELVALNGYVLMFFGPLVSLGNSWQVMRNGLTSAGSLERIFAREQETYHPDDARNLGAEHGLVKFDDVTFRYEKEQSEVLSHLSFIAKPGQTVAFVGESGVGKSSAISLLSGYYFPTEGRVLVDGIDTRQWDLLALRSRIAVVPQEVALFNDTIRVNIRYGSFDAPDSAVEHAAREAHIEEFILQLPKQYDTIVGERGIKLSVGQKQRIAIARAILRNPEFLVLDEPTSALDIETERLVTSSLEKLMRGRTTFIIAHRLSTVRRADQILVLKDGSVVERGSHADLLARDGIYRKLHDLHVGLYE